MPQSWFQSVKLWPGSEANTSLEVRCGICVSRVKCAGRYFRKRWIFSASLFAVRQDYQNPNLCFENEQNLMGVERPEGE